MKAQDNRRSRGKAPVRQLAPQESPGGKQTWLTMARDSLIKDGIASVQVGKLARRLKITRGGFYWFFKDHQDLLDQLLLDWEVNNTAAFKSVLNDPGHNGMNEFMAIVDIWINGHGFDPRWDAAVRDWARINPKVAAAVKRVDDTRVDVLKQVFLDLGYDEQRAFIRARVTYFHQVGYYSMGVKENKRQRLDLLPLYVEALTGRTDEQQRTRRS